MDGEYVRFADIYSGVVHVNVTPNGERVARSGFSAAGRGRYLVRPRQSAAALSTVQVLAGSPLERHAFFSGGPRSLRRLRAQGDGLPVQGRVDRTLEVGARSDASELGALDQRAESRDFGASLGAANSGPSIYVPNRIVPDISAHGPIFGTRSAVLGVSGIPTGGDTNDLSERAPEAAALLLPPELRSRIAELHAIG